MGITEASKREREKRWLDKVALAPMGTSPAEKIKCIERDFTNLALLTHVIQSGEAQLTFGHNAMGNPSLGVPILYLALAYKRIRIECI